MAAGTYETSFLDAVASNFLMTLVLSLPLPLAIHLLISLFKLCFSSSFTFLHYLTSLVFWVFLLFLLCISFVRKLERTEKSFFRLIEETIFTSFFFYGITPGGLFSRFGILNALAAGIAFVSNCSNSQRSDPSGNAPHPDSLINFVLNKRLKAFPVRKLFICYFSILFIGHIFLKMFSSLTRLFYYRLFATTQILTSVSFFIFGIVISKISFSIFEYFFSEKNFKNVAKSGSILLSGLQHTNSTMEYFALHELFCIGMFDESKRKRIFSEIEYSTTDGELVVSREIVKVVTKFFDKLHHRLERDMRYLRKFTDLKEDQRSACFDENIYKSGANRQRLFTSPPSFLKPTNKSGEMKFTHPLPGRPSEQVQNGDIDFVQYFMQFYLGKYILSSHIIYYRMNVISHLRAPLEYAALGISSFVVASYYEDIHGQVHLCLVPLLKSMHRLLLALEEFDGTTSGMNIIKDTEQMRPLQAILKRSIDAIVERYNEVLTTLSDSSEISNILHPK
jgi:hypothetical protein